MLKTHVKEALCAIALAAMLPTLAGATALFYVATPLTGVAPNGISADGTAVVGSTALVDASSGQSVIHAIVWKQGQAIDLGPGQARAINGYGHVAGSSMDASGTEFATVWIAQKPTQLSPGTAYAINGKDEVVGEAQGTDGLRHPAVWRQGVVKLLSTQEGRATGINTNGQIVGYVTTQVGGQVVFSAVRWVQDVPTILSTNALANAINDAGIVVGGPTANFASPYPYADYANGPYYWTADNQAHTAALEAPGDPYAAQLTAINNAGMVVGTADRSAVFGRITDHFSLVQGVIRFPDSPSYTGPGNGWLQAVAFGISDTGAIPFENGSGLLTLLQPTGPVACVVSGSLNPISSFAFSGSVSLVNMTEGPLEGWQVNETLKDPTIVYRMSQARIKVSNGGKLLTATPTTANQVINAGSSWSYNFGAAKFPATNPSITDLNATMGGQSCIWVN